METNTLERGNYTITLPENSPTTPPPSSAAFLYVENEIFDRVPCQNGVLKKKASFVVPDGSGTCKNTAEEFDYHQCKNSPADIEPSGAATWCSKETKKCCFNVTIALTLLIIIGLFTLPIIFYYVDVPQNDSLSQTDADNLVRQLEICLASGNSSSEFMNENMMTNRTMVADGDCYTYTAGVCLNHLLMTAMMHDILITNNSVIVKNNPRVSNPDSFVDDFTSSPLVPTECRRDGLPFVCNYAYLVCDSSGSSPVVLSDLEEECTQVSQGSCQQIWQIGAMLNLVPDCSNLDAEVSVTLPSSNITCHPQFDIRCSFCVPICEDFSETPESTQETIDIFFIVAACLMTIGSIVVLIVSVIRRKVMFDFPSVLIVYMTINFMVIGLLVLISFGAREHLYCSEPEVPIAYENPTVFCQLSGFLIHAGFVQIAVYWLLHLIHLFFKFFFPFAIRRFDTKKWKRAFHIGEVILVNMVTCIAPVYVITVSKYYPFGYPPTLCIPNSSVTFYGILLPNAIILCTGTCLLVLMFWRLQMRTGYIEKKKTKTSSLFKLSTPEVKLLALLCCFLVFGISSIIYFSLYARNYDFLISLVTEYVVCQAYGKNDSCEVIKDEMQDYRYHGLANTCYLLMGMLTISNLLFAVHVKQLKGQIRRLSVKASRTFRSMSVKEIRVTATNNKPSEEPYRMSTAYEY